MRGFKEAISTTGLLRASVLFQVLPKFAVFVVIYVRNSLNLLYPGIKMVVDRLNM